MWAVTGANAGGEAIGGDRADGATCTSASQALDEGMRQQQQGVHRAFTEQQQQQRVREVDSERQASSQESERESERLAREEGGQHSAW